MRINNNPVAFNAFRNVTSTEGALGKSLEKLSSGYRINRAADDAAGLVISQKLRSTVSGLKVAARNAQDGVSVVQTAEGALTEVHNMLQRIRDLVVQSVNAGSVDSTATDAAQAEVTALIDEIGRIESSTKFGGKALFGSEYSGVFQVGVDDGDTITVTIGAFVEDLSLSATETVDEEEVTTYLDVADTESLATLDSAIDAVSTLRGSLGAAQNRLESTIANLQVTTENLSASESRIRDTDMALEMVNFTRHQILLQAGTAMLAQANAVPQTTLRLLQ